MAQCRKRAILLALLCLSQLASSISLTSISDLIGVKSGAAEGEKKDSDDESNTCVLDDTFLTVSDLPSNDTSPEEAIKSSPLVLAQTGTHE